MKSRTADRKPAPVPSAAAAVTPAELTPVTSLSGFGAAWNRFWFTPTDPINLGLARVIGGLLILYVHFCYTFELASYIGGDQAWVDAPLTRYFRKEVPIFVNPDDWVSGLTEVTRGNYSWSIFYHISDPFWIWTLHFTFLGIMALFTLGLWTRITSVLTWLACINYIHRAPIMLFGMDAMIMILMFYLMIGPSGATLSLDRLLEIWKARRRFGPDYLPPIEPSVSAGVATRAIQVHFCFIYMGSGLSKLLGGRWWAGTALWACFANYSFAPMNVGLYYDALVFLTHHRWLWEIAMSSAALFTLWLEVSFSFLVWLPRWRWLMVGSAVLLHTGIGLFMGLVTFSLFMLVLLLAFIPPEIIHQLLLQLSTGGKTNPDAKDGRPGVRGKPALALTRT